MFTNKSILVTGGTGSFGTMFAREVLKNYSVKKLVIFSRDEMKQWEMQNEFAHRDNIRFLIGDVRDKERLTRAMRGIDIVIHAAAMKIVPAIERDPFECIKTNVIGAMNVINAAIDCEVSDVVALSTDKASSPINLYGGSKLCSDKMFLAANESYAKGTKTRFNIVRYGNVLGSRGSVIPFFFGLDPSVDIPITDERMTRFMITLPQAVNLVKVAAADRIGGKVFVHKIPSMRVVDIAASLFPGRSTVLVGIREGEKIHEQMIAAEESERTMDMGDYYLICSTQEVLELAMHEGGARVPKGFRYSSDNNERWMSSEELSAWAKSEGYRVKEW